MALLVNASAAIVLALNTFIYAFATKQLGLKLSISTIVLFAEIVKLLVSALLELRQSFQETTTTLDGKPIEGSWKQLKRFYVYAIPAALYAFNNMTTFVTMGYMDPGTYQILSNFKVLTTGALAFLWYKQALHRNQVIAMVLLTLGGMLCVATDTSPAATQSTIPSVASAVSAASSVATSASSAAANVPSLSSPSTITVASESLGQSMGTSLEGLGLVLLMCCISAVAGLSCEMLMKADSAKCSLHMQNMQMPLASICVILVQKCITGDLRFNLPMHPLVVANVLTQAGAGLLIACIIRFQSTVSKLFIQGAASVVSVTLTATIFHYQLTARFLVGAFLVSVSMYLYYNKNDLFTSFNRASISVAIRIITVVAIVACIHFAPLIHFHFPNQPEEYSSPLISNRAKITLRTFDREENSPFLKALEDEPLYYPVKKQLDFEIGNDGYKQCAHIDCSYDVSCEVGRGPDCCNWINLKLLLVWKDTAERYHLPYSLTFGSLLGAIRNHTILPWTGDSDIVIDSTLWKALTKREELLKTIHLDLSSKGYNFYHHIFGRLCVGVNNQDPQIQPRIFRPRQIKNDYSHPYMDLFWDQSTRWKHVFSLPVNRSADINGFEFPVPHNAEECLAAWYTERWRIPRPVLHGVDASGHRTIW
jgi:drug/metabolite transporter (DMT)-like permease